MNTGIYGVFHRFKLYLPGRGSFTVLRGQGLSFLNANTRSKINMIIGTNAVYASWDDRTQVIFFQTVAGSLVQRSSLSGLVTLALDRKWTDGWEMSSVWWFSASVLSDRAEFIKGKGFFPTWHWYFTLVGTGSVSASKSSRSGAGSLSSLTKCEAMPYLYIGNFDTYSDDEKRLNNKGWHCCE